MQPIQQSILVGSFGSIESNGTELCLVIGEQGNLPFNEALIQHAKEYLCGLRISAQLFCSMEPVNRNILTEYINKTKSIKIFGIYDTQSDIRRMYHRNGGIGNHEYFEMYVDRADKAVEWFADFLKDNDSLQKVDL